MPVPVPIYEYPPETNEPLDWAELPTVDLSKIDTEEGKKEQAQILIDAVRQKGFFYVKGYDISQDRIDRQFAIGKEFYDLPVAEKTKFTNPNLDKGDYNGYRPAGRRILDAESGITDRIETYNIPKFGNGYFDHTGHPKPIEDNLEVIERFSRDLHTKILDPLFVLTAVALELPENYLKDLHQYEAKSEDHLRYMHYTRYTPEETAKIGHLWTQGHTDLGSYTLLARQNVAALQIKDNVTGEWKWAKPQPGTFTVNSCDALSFLTGNYIKSTVHRVSSPPKDQAHLNRLGLLYFARPHNDIPLATIKSPVLEREGYTQNEFERGNHAVPTMEEFVKAKQTWQQKGGSYRHGETIVPGFQGQIIA